MNITKEKLDENKIKAEPLLNAKAFAMASMKVIEKSLNDNPMQPDLEAAGKMLHAAIFGPGGLQSAIDRIGKYK